ncbi:MAG: hypothetical protein ACR2OL_08325 [Anderseniella sp.]
MGNALGHGGIASTRAITGKEPGHALLILVADGSPDMVTLAREVLVDPNLPLTAKFALEADDGYRHWPEEAGCWLERRDRLLNKLNLRNCITLPRAAPPLFHRATGF